MRATEEEKRKSDLIARLKPREKNEKRFTCVSPKNINISEFPALKDCLPDSYDYHVCHYKAISEAEDHLNFSATLRMALSTEEDIKQWVNAHAVTWRVDRTDPGKRQKVLFKVDFRCQHKTRPRGVDKVPGRSKNTDCPAKMTVTLLRTLMSRGRQSLSTDPHVPTFPTIATICSDHNHSLCVADAQRPRAVGHQTGNSHEAAAAGFAKMCQELSAMVQGDSSFTASAVAAVKTFQNIKHNPAKVVTALRLFGRHTDLASVQSKPVRKRCLAAGRPTVGTTGTDHDSNQSAKRARTPAAHNLADSVSEGESPPK